MESNKVLRFQVAIQDNATKGLEEIEKKFLGLSNQAVTVVGNINNELKKIGGISFNMPDLSKMIGQLNNLQDTVSKKNVGDIPIFKNTLEQMQQLQNFIGKNTLSGELDRVKRSINGVFAEIPNVNVSSFTNYFNQLSKAYNDFLSKMGNSRTIPKEVADIGGRMNAMGGLAGNNSLLREYQAQAEQIKATIINTINEVRNSIDATKTLLSSKALDFGKISDNIDKTAEALNKLSDAFTRFNGTIGGDKNLLNMMTGMGEIIRNVKLSMSQLQQGQENLNWGKTMQDNVKSVLQARAELEKLVPLVEKLKTQQLLSKNLGLDTANIDATIQRVQHLQQLLSSITMSGGLSVSKTEGLNGLNTSQLMSVYGEHLIAARNDLAAQGQANAQALKNETQAQRENSLAKQQGISANAQLSQEESRLTNAIQQSTNSMHGQSQVLSDLKSMAFQYLSIYGIQSFVTNMAQITGELQLQAKSLEVILNNASAAKQMYGEIRDLSQMSPYTFEDLLRSHRQLAAFGIEPKDMFATMKSLADIGAGLDVDISRLILAFGHTRSYGYLSGIQNRQFENAGIDMIGGLAAKYNELADAEKRAGREANYVTRADIFKRMRARSIPFEDVQDVVLDLDRPGGKFYNMQIRQFETLGGKLRNLRNNYRIMMSELGNSNQGVLMGTVNIINDLTEHWEKYARVIKGVALAYATLKLAGLASNKAVAAANKELTMFSVERNRSMGTTAYLNGTMGMWRAMGSSRKWGAQTSSVASVNNDGAVLNLATDEKINNFTKQRIALTGKLTTAQRELLLVESGIGKARAAQIAGFSAWKRGLMSVRLSMIAVAQSAKAMAVALLFNPMTWVFAAVAGFTALSDKMSKAGEDARDFKKAIEDTVETDIKGLKEILEPYENNGVITIKGISSVTGQGYAATKKNIDIDKSSLIEHGIDAVYEELKRALQVQSPLYDGDYFDINKAEGQEKQVEAIFRKLESISYVKQIEQMKSDALEIGLKDTGTNGLFDPTRWFNGEGLGENMKDYAEAQAEFINSVRVTETEWNNYKKEDKKAIEEYMRDLGISRDEAIAKYLQATKYKEQYKQDANSSKFSFLGPLSFVAGMASQTFDKNTRPIAQLEVLKGDLKKFAPTIAGILKDSFSGDVDGGMTLINDLMNKLFSQKNIGSPETKQRTTAIIVSFIKDSMAEAGNALAGQQLLAKMIEQQVGSVAVKTVQDKVNLNTSRGEASRIVAQASKNALSGFFKSTPELLTEWKKMSQSMREEVLKNIKNALTNLAKARVLIKSWQDEARKAGLSIDFNTEQDYTEFIKKQRKAIKDAQEILDANEKKLRFELGVNIDLKIDSLTEAKKLKDAINKQLQYLFTVANKFKKEVIKKYGKLTAPAQEQIQEYESRYIFLKTMRDTPVQDISRSGSFLDDQHQSWTDDKKKKGKGNGRTEDKYAKNIRSQARLLGEAYNEYKKWEDKIGNEGALKKVQEQFFGKGSALTKAGFSFKDVPNYYRNLEKLRDELNKYYGTKKGRNNYVLDAIKELDKSMNQVKFDDFTKASDEWASKVSLYLDRLTKKWELYNKVLATTGDKQLSMSLSGFKSDSYQNQADELKAYISKELQGYGVKSAFNFDENASDKDIENSVKNALGEGADAEKIKSVVEELKKWRDLQQEINRESIETYANLVGGLTRFMDVVRKANSEYDNTMEKLGLGLRNGKITQTQYDEGERLAAAKRDRTTNESSFGYKELMSGNTALTIKSAIENANIAKRLLERQFKEGAVSAEEYAKKVKEINTALNTLKDKKTTSMFSTFLNGGLQGVRDRKRDEAYDTFVKSADKAETAVYERDKAKKEWEANPNDTEAFNKYMAASIKAAKALDKKDKDEKKYEDADRSAEQRREFTKKINNAITALEKLNSAVNLLGSVFSSLGMDGAANAIGDTSMMLGGALQGASSLSFLGPEAMIAGAGLGLISGIAQAHDNRLERQIEKLREDVTKIEGYTHTIAKAQERTLGYDNGDLMRAYQKQYADSNYQLKVFGRTSTMNKGGAAGKAMQDYYNSAGGGDINGYQQQYNLLLKQRQDYVDMYNKEDAKKKKSQAALEESKQKIAELDDQIRFFSEDLAKSLWDIDVKGWADQLSDALMSAFENGENMANAYGDTVRNILQSIGAKMIQLQIMEPMFEKLRTKLFGDGKDNKGVFDPNDVAGSAKKVTDVVADFFGQNGDGKNAIVAAQEALAAYEKGLNDAGLPLKNNSNSTLSSGIQGTSEETSALLAGYINALRQDVSVIRIIQTQFINEAWPDYIKQITGMATTLGRIDANVAAIRSIISENGALYDKIDSLAEDLHGVILGTKKLHIE